jgi:hypothetical protein
LYWTAAIFFLGGIALVDTAIIALCAALITPWLLTVSLASYSLIAVGILFTIWQMSAICNKTAR